MSNDIWDDDFVNEAIKNHMKEYHITKGEALMSFWANFQEAAKGQTNEEQKMSYRHAAFSCLEKVLELDPNDQVFSKRPGGRAELLRLYDASMNTQKAEEAVGKAKEELQKAKARYQVGKSEMHEKALREDGIAYHEVLLTLIYEVIRNWMVLHCAKTYTTDMGYSNSISRIGMRVLILPIWEYDSSESDGQIVTNTHKIKYISSNEICRRICRIRKVRQDVLRIFHPLFPEEGMEIQDKLLHKMLYHLEGEEEVPVLYEGKIKNFIQWNQIDKTGLSEEAKQIHLTEYTTSVPLDTDYTQVPVEISSTEKANDGKIGYVKAVKIAETNSWDAELSYWNSLPNDIFSENKDYDSNSGKDLMSEYNATKRLSITDLYTFDAEVGRYINKNDGIW